MQPAEIFLSHSSSDRDLAGRLASTLTAHGVPVFYAPQNIVGAQQWQNEILAALQRCDWFLVLLSPAAVNSMWLKREVAFALKEPRYEDRIVPMLYQSCELGSLQWLTLYQMISFTGDFVTGCRDLFRTWGIGLREELIR